MKKIIFFCCIYVIFLVTNSDAQIINTIAGSGTHTGYTCNGCPATSTELTEPSLAIDKSGNIYTSDANNNTIRKIDSLGVIRTIAGNGTTGYSGDGGPATAASLNDPSSLTVDYKGNIFFFDAGNYVIRKIDTAGVITTYAGTGTLGFNCEGCMATATDFTGAGPLVTDKRGNLFFGSTFVYKIDSTGWLERFEGIFTGMGDSTEDGVNALHYQTGAIFGICPDDSGNVFIAMTRLGGLGVAKIIRVDTLGLVTTIAGSDTAGFHDGVPATDSHIFASNIVMDSIGNIYFYGYQEWRVGKITKSTGFVNTIAGNGLVSWYSGFGDGGNALSARVFTNGLVAVDRHGDLYITDVDRIRKIYNSTTALGEIINRASEISLYPNPADNTLTITSSTIIGHLEIMNTIGQMVISRDYATGKAEVNIAALPKGFYLAKFNNTQVLKFIKK